jgi:hypothetical protein
MLLVAILAVAAFVIAGLVVWLLRNEVAVKHVADEYAGGKVSFDRERLGA